MGLIESLKAAGIRTADALNRLNDPFPAFDRPALPKEERRLHDLEAEFYQDLVGNFWVCDGQVLAHRLPLPAGSLLDLGDQAIWHGVYTAMLAMRWNLYFHDSADSAGPIANSTFSDLIQAAKGLQLHQTIHGEPTPRLIRGVSDDLKTWQDDASNDSATGHLLGIYFGWKFGPDTLQPVFASLALGLGSELLAHHHALVGPTGAPTTYGALEQGWKTDPLRLTLALAIYAVAASLTQQPAFMKAYSDLWARYRQIVAYPKVKLWWMENSGDAHRGAIHLAILADLTTGEPAEIYRSGLRRLRVMCSKIGNVWVNALCRWGCGEYGQGASMAEDREQALKVLSEFTLAEKQYNRGVDNYARVPRSIQFTDRPLGWSWEPILWNGVYMANQPLPRWAVRSQDFFWQRNLRSLDVGSNGAPADSRLNGGDFLAAFWLSRLTGILSATD